jgi:hypothetical protein
MDIHSQIMETIKTTIQEFKVEMQHIQEKCIQEFKVEMQHIQEECIHNSTISRHIMDECNKKRYDWYDFEADCDDWDMDSCHLLDDNYFHILFDDSSPPHVENMNAKNREPIIITSV